MVIQDRIALEAKSLPDEQAHRALSYIQKLQRTNSSRDEEKQLAIKRKAFRRLQKHLKPLDVSDDYKSELETALREKYESL